MLEIVIDTGGTFTDGIVVEDRRRISTGKFPTNVADPAISIIGCVRLLAQERNFTEQELLANTSTVVIGTTLATNSILEGKGAKCCLLYTKGFRDIPELGRRIPRADVYNPKVPPPPTLIPRHLRFPVEERIQHDGKIITPLNENDVLKAARNAREQNVEVPVVCFLHSYINPVHEEKAAEIMKNEYPDIVVSSHILRRWIEWDRLTTAALAGFIKPMLHHFIRTLEDRLKDAGFSGTLLFVTCAGGVATPEVCLENPALFIGGGPSAGALLGRFLAELAGFESVIIGDMGGTSFDVSMLPHQTILTTTDNRVGDYKSGCESVDIASVGAGGGSLAWIDNRGVLRVGPFSAGADPGPACYGKGGRMPTVTDADVILGYVPTDYFLGGTIRLDASLAKKAIEENIANPLGINVVDAAHAISSLVEANMAERVFLTAVKKGLDPKDFTLIIGGGAGPVHAVAIATRMNMRQLYIPRHAAVFCALGMAVGNYKYILSSFLYRREDEADVRMIKGIYDSLEEAGQAILARQGVTQDKMKFIRGGEMRYYGQLHDIEVLFPETGKGEAFTEETRNALIKAFHDGHKVTYGWADPAMTVVIAILKLHAIGIRNPLELVKQPFISKDSSGALKRKRHAYFKNLGGFVETPCYDADGLRQGNIIMGPAIIEDTKTTVVVPPGAEITVDAYGNYVIRR